MKADPKMAYVKPLTPPNFYLFACSLVLSTAFSWVCSRSKCWACQELGAV